MESRYTVHVLEQIGYDMQEIAEKLLVSLREDGLDIAGKSVYLKPSFVFPVPEKMLHTCTHPVFIAGTCIALHRCGAASILIGEGPTFGPARYNAMVLKVKAPIRLAVKKGLLPEHAVTFFYHDDAERIKVDVPNPFVKKSFTVPKAFLDTDLFISLPKLKVNIFAGVTLSVKNNFGLIPMKERLEYHAEDIHRSIADLYRIRVPDYVITDAIISGEGQGPMEATPVKSSLIFTGRNGLAVDVCCCHLMGIDTGEIEHLKLLHDKGLGPIDFRGIGVRGQEALNRYTKKYAIPDPMLETLSSDLKVYSGTNIHGGPVCVPGCRGFLRALLDGYGMNEPEGFEGLKGTIIVGKNPPISLADLSKIDRKKTIVYGDCAEAYRNYGWFVQGCPPSYGRAMKVMRKPLGRITPWFKFISIPKLMQAYLIHFLRKFRLQRFTPKARSNR